MRFFDPVANDGHVRVDMSLGNRKINLSLCNYVRGLRIDALRAQCIDIQLEHLLSGRHLSRIDVTL